MKKLKFLIIAVVALAAVAFVARVPILRGAGNFLHVAAAPEKADFIYVFAGGIAERCERGFELYEKGYADRILTAGSLISDQVKVLGLGYTEAEMNMMMLIKLGVPPGKIVAPRVGTSTLEELLYIRDYMDENKLDTALLVTSPFHSRRVKMAAEKVFKGTGRRIIVTSSRWSEIDLDNWWKEERSLIIVQNEYIKLLLYYFKYVVLSDHPGLRGKKLQ
ncbi:MAG: YdcF family protein [bacterium]